MSLFSFSSIDTRFDERKTAAAAALLLSKAGGRMEYMRLLKLLYMADRESWDRYGRPITGDKYSSLDHGPILSQTYNLIKAEGETEAEVGPWQQTVERVSRYDVGLRGDPDLGPLSDAEVELLGEIYDRYSKYGLWSLVSHLHEVLPEWTNPKGSSIKILPETILKTLGKSSEEIKEVREGVRERAAFGRLLGAE